MKIPHGVILASAGSGKTYRLSRRILGLLAHGAKPGEIVALTFTRKAAAEFVSRVLTTLATAAMDAAAAASLAKSLALSGENATPAFFQKLLEGTVAQSHRLRFGTMDGFFQSLVRTHPLELGLAGGFTLLDARRAARERGKILRSLLRAPAAEVEAGAFLEAFRLASFGKDARGVSGLLETFAGGAMDLYRESGDAGLWGDRDAVWPKGTAWFPAPTPAQHLAACEALAAELGKFSAGHATLDKSLRTFAANALAHRPGAPPGEIGKFAEERFMPIAALKFLLRGEALTLHYSGKDRTLPASVSAALGAVLRGVIAWELEARLQRTAGTGRLIAAYSDRYEAEVIGAGLLGFSDITHTLAKPEHAAVLGQAAYRLDGAVSHWLFDEFQDTSRRTWSILAACAGEVLAHGDGARSAFFVGDVKQAIYAWNGGDHHLLPELCETHALHAEELTATQRCGPEVTALVNAVCGHLADAPGLPITAREDWAAAWKPHTCGDRALANTGYSRWVVVDKPGKDDEADAVSSRLDVVINRIHEAGFLAAGLTVGLLTRTNAEAKRAAEALRAAGLPCVCETDVATARDNPATLTLLAALRHAAHPGDTLARETVAMSPLAALLGGPLARVRLLAGIAADGVEATLEGLVAEGGERIPSDAFTHGRVGNLIAIAREYDATGERDASAFVAFAEGTLRRDTAAAGRVQVMTVHKSKGLEFDVVFLPFLEGDPVDTVESGAFEALRDTRAGPPRAVISTPPAMICEADATLGENLDERRAGAAYEQLCALYVALTRAKRELTLISHAPPKATDEARAPRWTGLLAHAFEVAPGSPSGEVYAWGEPDWNVGFTVPRAAIPDTVGDVVTPFAPRAIPRAVTPSGLKDKRASPTSGGESVASSGGGKLFGTEVHRVFEALERTRPGEPESLLRERLHAATAVGAPDAVRHADAMDHVMAALRSPDFTAAFCIAEADTVCVELPFAWLRAEDELVAGTFDRVVLHGDGTATLYDFKTDACAPGDLVGRYGEAMRLYREAASALFGLPAARIRLVLLHTGTGLAVEVA